LLELPNCGHVWCTSASENFLNLADDLKTWRRYWNSECSNLFSRRRVDPAHAHSFDCPRKYFEVPEYFCCQSFCGGNVPLRCECKLADHFFVVERWWHTIFICLTKLADFESTKLIFQVHRSLRKSRFWEIINKRSRIHKRTFSIRGRVAKLIQSALKKQNKKRAHRSNCRSLSWSDMFHSIL